MRGKMATTEARKPIRPLREFVIDRSPETSLRGIPLGLLRNENSKDGRNGGNSDNNGFTEKANRSPPEQAEASAGEDRSAERIEPVCGVSTSLLRKAIHDVLGPNIKIYEKPYFE